MIDLGDAPRFDWRPLNDDAQIAVSDGRITGIVYAVKAGTATSVHYEFWWLPAGDVSREEVLFGLSPGVKEWETRWESAHRAAQWIEDEWAEAQRRST